MVEQATRILIVEDREDHAALLEALLEEGLANSKLKIEYADSGETGVSKLLKSGYDICLLDYHLDGEPDGLAVLRTVRAKAVTTPVIFMTAQGDEDVAVEAMKSGAQDYVRKDALTAELLRSTISYSIGLRREEALRREAQDELKKAKDARELKVKDLDAANEKLARLTRRKDAFVQSISHELRTPLTSIKLYHTLLNAHPGESAQYLATLRRETDRLYHIIEDLLRVAMASQQPEKPERMTVNLNYMVLLYVADRALLAEQRGLNLTVSEDSGNPRVQGDRAQLERALGILVMNALNYTPEGGEVNVRVLKRKSKGKAWVGFSVSDTGPGIPADEQKQLFHRFYRGSAALERGVPGTGLGLYMARQIAERHGGRVEVSSDGEPGKGATFEVWLPAIDAS